jgi:hypothetical protein
VVNDRFAFNAIVTVFRDDRPAVGGLTRAVGGLTLLISVTFPNGDANRAIG